MNRLRTGTLVAALTVVAVASLFLAWLALRSSPSEGSRAPRTRTGSELASRAAAQAFLEQEIATTPLAAGSGTFARSSSRPAPRRLPALETVAIRGRLVLASGDPVRSGRVWLRSGDDEIDFREVVERLGGPHAKKRLEDMEAIEYAVHELGGWQPSFAADALADGTFTMRVPRALSRFTFGARARGAVHLRAEPQEIPRAEEVVFTVVLDPAGSIEGKIVDETGAGIPGAVALCSLRAQLASPGMGSADVVGSLPFVERRLATADQDGRFVLDGIPAGRNVLAIVAPARIPATRWPIEVKPGIPTRVEIRLSRGHVLDGSVVDAQGVAVVDALVRAEPMVLTEGIPWYGLARTGRSGEFRVDGLLPGTHRIHVVHPTLVDAARPMSREEVFEAALGGAPMRASESRTVSLPITAGSPPLRITLGEGNHVSGRVIDSDGQPLAFARVEAESQQTSSLKSSAETDEFGAFRLMGLDAGPFDIIVSARDIGAAESRDVAAGAMGLELVVRRTGIAGRVLDDATGTPISRFRAAWIRAGPVWSTFWEEERHDRLFDSADGSFTLEGVPAGDQAVVVRADGYLDAVSDAVLVAEGKITGGTVVRLSSAAAVRGRVVDAADGTPIERAVIGIRSGEPSGQEEWFRPRARTDTAGGYVVKDAQPGSFTVVAIHDEYVEARSSVLSATSGASVSVLPLAMERGGSIEGVARDGSGQPIVGESAWIALTRWVGSQEPERKVRFATTDQNGVFRATGLAVGTWSATIMAFSSPWRPLPEERLELRGRVDVQPGKTSRLELKVIPRGTCTVLGRVLKDGRPIEEAMVMIEIDRNAQGERVSARRGWENTDTDGRFTTDAVPAGDGYVRVMARGVEYTQRIRVPEEPEMEDTIEVPAGGTIAGSVVRRSDGSPLRATLRVKTIGTEDDQLSVNTWSSTKLPEGRYRLDGLPAGRYRVCAEQTPDENGRVEVAPEWRIVVVAEGETSRQDFALDSLGDLLVNVVRPDGTPAAEAKVLLRATGDRAESFEATETKTTDIGAAVFTILPPGDFTVSARSQGFPWSAPEAVRVKSGERTSVNVRLERGFSLQVRALDAQGIAVLITSALARNADGLEAEANLPADGALTATLDVSTGKHFVEVEAGALRGSRDVVVGDSPPDEVVVTVSAPEQAAR